MGWKITYQGVTKTPSEWGIANLKLQIISQGQDLLSFDADGLKVDLPEIFEYGKTLALRYEPSVIFGGPNPSGNDPYRVFQGIVIETPASGSGRAESHSYTVAGPWWYLDNLVYQLQWKLWKFQNGNWTASDQYISQLLLGLDYNGLNISTREVVEDIIGYAIAQGVPIQLGSVLPDRPVAPTKLYPPPDEVRDRTCAEAIEKMLRWHTDAVTWFDYTFEPPKLHMRVRDDLALAQAAIEPITVLGRQGQRKISAVQVRPRYDLQRDVVAINYIVRGSRDEQETADRVPDTYPPSATGREIGALVLTLDMQGARIATVDADVEAEPVDFFNAATWLARIPRLADQRVDPASIVGPYEVTSNSELGFPRELLSGQVAEWMIEDGSPVLAEDVVWQAKFDFKQYETSARTGDPGKAYVGKVFTIRTKMTNARTGTYSTIQSFDAGDPLPVGLAEYLQKALSPLTFDGELQLIEEECSRAISVGNVLAITGGKPEWAGMRALIQKASFDLDNGSSSIGFGPPAHLAAGDIVDLLKVGRMRVRWTNPRTRSTGTAPNSAFKLGSDSENLDTNEGAEAYQQFSVKDSTPTAGPRSIFIDGTNGKISAAAGNPNAAAGTPNAPKKIDINFKDGQVSVVDQSSHATEAQQRKIDLSVADCKSTDNQNQVTNRPIKVRELTICIDKDSNGTEKKYRILIPCSEPYPLPDGTNPDCAGGGDLRYRGEWVSKTSQDPNPYKKGDIVRISTGIVAGTYVATATPGAGELPYQGVNWTLIGTLVDQSDWL